MEHESGPVLATPVVSAESRWEDLRAIRSRVSKELETIAREIQEPVKSRLKKVAAWFDGPASFEEALKHRDVLAIFTQFLEFPPDTEWSQTRIASVARSGARLLGNKNTSLKWALSILLYPLTMLVAATILLVVGSFLIMPGFQEMFDAFGIELPHMTTLVIQVSTFLREWWLVVLGVPLMAVALLIVGVQDWSSSPSSMSLLERLFQSRRLAQSDWAWHVAMLLRIGIPLSEAVKIANANSQKIHAWDFSGHADSEYHSGNSSDSRFRANGWPLLDAALNTDNIASQTVLLEQISVSSRDNSRLVGSWLILWITTLFQWVMVTLVFLAIYAVVAPLIGIISGLTAVF